MRKLIIGAAIGAVLAAGTSVAVASIPSSNGTITACVNTQNGNVTKIIDTDAGQHCANNETTVTWNQTGPQGPQGPAGTNGTNGVSGYEVVAGTIVITGPNSSGHASGTVSCPAGKVALGAGASSDVTSDQPTEDGTGWTYNFTIPFLGGTNEQYNFHSNVTCAITS